MMRQVIYKFLVPFFHAFWFFLKNHSFWSFPAIWFIFGEKIFKFNPNKPFCKIAAPKSSSFMDKLKAEFLHCLWKWIFVVSLPTNTYDGTELSKLSKLEKFCLFVSKEAFLRNFSIPNKSGCTCPKTNWKKF